MKRLFYIPLCLLCIFAVLSCVSENRDDCLGDECDCLRIHFSYRPVCLTSRDNLNNHLERVDLFVFDENGIFIDSWMQYSPDFASGYTMDIALEEGNYKFFAWGNMTDDYYITPSTLVKGVTSIDDIHIHLEMGNNDTIYQEPKPIYFSNLENERISSEIEEISMNLNHNVHRVNLSVHGLQDSQIPTDSISVIVADSHSSFKIDNTYVYSPDNFHYMSRLSVDQDNVLSTTMTLMKLSLTRETLIQIYNHSRNEIMYESDLINLIRMLGNQGVVIDFDNTCIFEVDLIFDEGGNFLNVLINGWKVVEDEGQIHI